MTSDDLSPDPASAPADGTRPDDGVDGVGGVAPVLVDGRWRPAGRPSPSPTGQPDPAAPDGSAATPAPDRSAAMPSPGGSVAAGSFVVRAPATGAELGVYPVSPWSDVDAALTAGRAAYDELQALGPEPVAAFLDGLADRLEAAADRLVATAHDETALPAAPRLRDVELPRTTDQLRQAAAAARSRSWRQPVLSPAAGIAAMHTPLPGVVAVLGPNNFPFAFNAVGGGDFAAAVATGHPVLAKSNPGHPGTTALLAAEALAAAHEAGLPAATVQLLHHVEPTDGYRLVADPRIAATAYTGSRAAGLRLKQAADAAGRAIHLELSSVNPVVVLPGALAERGAAAVAAELAGSVLLGGGQFCTSPGLILALAGSGTDLRDALAAELGAATGATLLGPTVADALGRTVAQWVDAGAQVLATGRVGAGCSAAPTLATVDGTTFLAQPAALQAEAFGSAALVVLADDVDQLVRCVEALEGNLTGTVHSARDGTDDALYARVEPPLRERVGRLLNDKVPTGVAVVPAMHHGGPWPSTGAPQFTSVGLPAALLRFTQRQSWDGVRDERLPPELQAANPLGLDRTVADRA